MSSRTLPKLNLSLETMRAMYRVAYRVMGWFVNLEAVEEALLSSRLIEYPFIIQKLDGLPRGNVLDVGCTDGSNLVAPTLAAIGWQVHGIDIREFRLRHPNFHFTRGDIRRSPFPDDFFDCVYAVSSVEHIGLAGRYGVKADDPEGDFKAVQEVERMVKPDGLFLLTVPYGTGGIVRPSERVYDRDRLQRLLSGWSVREAVYWYLDSRGDWHQVEEEIAGRTRTPGGVCVALLELANDKVS